ncbi:MAG: 3'(2'),5'-bisphosphate nucleotidase CysQ [Bacilli bacterium]|nr:3'(2'),5'-bisphosphate nucleotidase CysQ [Bacilli bacterium]
MYEKELEMMIKAAKEAEKKILEIYNTDFPVEIKSDNSPVTAADKAADAMIVDILSKAFPEYGFLTEESTDTKERLSKKAIFIVDPVDGTKEFVSKNGEFTTNIALAVDHVVVVGVINIPTWGVTYCAIKGQGAFVLEKDGIRTPIHTNDKLEDLTVLKSRSFLNPKEVTLIEKHSDVIKHQETRGAAIKFCKIADGSAEISYRMSSSTKEWDVAAGDVILTEAGGIMLKPDGTPYSYNREDPYNREGYILANRKENFLF